MQQLGKAIFSAFTKLDSFSDWLLHPVTKVFCSVTGRTNFTLARITLVLGYILIVIANLHDFVREPTSGWNAFTVVLITPYWGWMSQRRFKFYGHIEESLEASQDALHIDLKEMHSYGFDRLFLNPFMLLSPFGMVLMRAGAWGFFLWIASHYFAFQFHGGGKSVVRRAVEALKKAGAAALDKAKDLVPQPVPAPVPIGV